eukprot:COSAG05_NODE_7828_length_765_cov_1.430931_1_plen_205_part_10
MPQSAAAAAAAAEKVQELAQIEKLRRQNATLRLAREAAEAGEEQLLQQLRDQNAALRGSRTLSKAAGAAARWGSKQDGQPSSDADVGTATSPRPPESSQAGGNLEGLGVPSDGENAGGKPSSWESASPLLSNIESVSSIGAVSTAGAADPPAQAQEHGGAGAMYHSDLLLLLPRLQQHMHASLEHGGTADGSVTQAAAAVVETAI